MLKVQEKTALTVSFHTLGCKVNQYETQAMKECFEESGFVCLDFGQPVDVCVVNTCAVTSESERQSRYALRRAYRSGNGKPPLVVAVGCAVEKNPEKIYLLPGIRMAIGTKGRAEICRRLSGLNAGGNNRESAVDNKTAKTTGLPVDEAARKNGARLSAKPREAAQSVSNTTASAVDIYFEKFEEMPISRFDGHSRAFLKIQDGCDNACAYCCVSGLRGPGRSRAPENILAEAKRLARAGYQEIVLTGVNLGSYGRDSCVPLNGVIKNLLKVEGFRIRMSSLEPETVSSELLELMAGSKRICRHLHIPLQSGDGQILKLMNRHFSLENFRKLVSAARNSMPDIGVTTDVMVGFPGETEKHFENTLEFVREMCFSKIHVFRYSKRQGTPAAEMKQVPGEISMHRSNILRSVAGELSQQFCRKFIGKTMDVLVEKNSRRHLSTGTNTSGLICGLSDNYLRIFFRGNDELSGKIIPVKVMDLFGTVLAGRQENL